jgi:uncharacterized membrane protein YedE/YeeE
VDELNLWLIGGGFIIGLLFGIAVQRTQFCMVAAVSNVALMHDFRHAHAYLAAVAVAILGTLVLESSGLVAISETGYRVPRYDWLLIAGGGLLFGLGSVLAGGCAGRTSVRAAEGNLGAWVVLLAFALTAAATYFGALEPYRVWLMQRTAVELSTGDSALSVVVGLPLYVGPVALAVVCVAGIVLLGHARQSFRLIAVGILIGALVVAGWFVTGYLSQDGFSAHGAASITVAGPLARATVFLTTGSLPGYGFSVAVLLGIMGGALGSALVTRSFHLVIPEAHHLTHLLVGGAFMGIGAICAGGCNIGNGLTGMSTGSIRALTAVIAIVAGMLLGIALLTRTEKGEETKDYRHPQATPGAGIV